MVGYADDASGSTDAQNSRPSYAGTLDRPSESQQSAVMDRLDGRRARLRHIAPALAGCARAKSVASLPRTAPVGAIMLPLLGQFLLSGCDPRPDEPHSSGPAGSFREDDALPAVPTVEEAALPPIARGEDGSAEVVSLVFASRTATDGAGEVTESDVFGDLSIDVRDRVARPWRFVDEETSYAEHAWVRSDAGDTVTRGYEVWATEHSPVVPTPSNAPLVVNTNVLNHLSNTQPSDSEVLRLDLKVRDFPEWNIPLPGDALFMSAADVDTATARRTEALDRRQADFDASAEQIVADVESSGGVVLTRIWKAGWVSVEVPRTAFETLATHPDIIRIDGPYGKRLSEMAATAGSVGGSRDAAYLEADQFIDNGWDGNEPNGSGGTGRHQYGAITLGMTEPGGYESGACAFRDWQGCSSASRIAATYRCDYSSSNWCVTGTVDTNTSADAHGTSTTAIAIADYKDGQANGVALGDPSWASNSCNSSADCNGQACEGGLCTHDPLWENNRTGMAPEAMAVLFGRIGSDGGAAFTDMFDDAMDLNLDITSSSWGWGDQDCDLPTESALEDEIENAFDDGILVVFSGNNEDGDELTSCAMWDPQDTVKAFVVNAYDANKTDCTDDPSTRCLLDKDSCPGGIGCSGRGGADVQTVGGQTINNAVTVQDTVAPNDIWGNTTSTSGTQGSAPPSTYFVGTSAAAPHVAGLAAVVKDHHLDNLWTWVNSPGRLHTVMLLMADRHYSMDPSSNVDTVQRTASADPWYGMGRSRLRLFESGFGLSPFGYSMATYTRSSIGTVAYYPFGTTGLPSSVDIVKCVTMQDEDLSSKTQTVEFKMTLNIRPNAGNTTCTGTPSHQRVSDNFDTKKLTALESASSASFTGKCVEVVLEWENTGFLSLTTHTACYYAGIDDDVSQ